MQTDSVLHESIVLLECSILIGPPIRLPKLLETAGAFKSVASQHRLHHGRALLFTGAI